MVGPQTTRNGVVAIDPHTTRSGVAWDHSLARKRQRLVVAIYPGLIRRPAKPSRIPMDLLAHHAP